MKAFFMKTKRMEYYFVALLCLVLCLVPGALLEVAEVLCEHSVECIPGTECVSDYCQISPCSADSQCVKQQVCSHDHTKTKDCVYSVDLKAEETQPFTLKFPSPPPQGATSFREIRWFKGSRGQSIVYYAPPFPSIPKYFGGYCAQTCNSSSRVTLDVTTGDLTIHEINLRDEDYYYFKYSVSEDHEEGYKYEIKLEVTSPGGNIGLYVAAVVVVVVVLGILICCAVFVVRYKKMRKRLSPIYRKKVPQEDYD